MNFSAKQRGAGFTLIELLLTLGLIGIIAGMATASLSSLNTKIRISSSINNLVHILHLARQESWSAGTDVVLCKSRGLTDCEHQAQWHDGWLLFRNFDQDNPPQIDAGETILRKGTVTKGVRISANRRAFVLRPFGLRSTNGTLVVCDPNARLNARAVIVSYTGKPRVSQTDSKGNDVRCAAEII